MKRISFILALLSVPAFAGTLKFDFRTDWDTATYNEAYQAAGRSNSSALLIQTGRLDYQNQFNEDISYRLRASFNNYKTNDGVDKLAPNVDLAYVSHKMNWLELTVGKFQTDISSHEVAQQLPEIYFKSETYKVATEGHQLDTTTYFFHPFKFATGLRLAANLSETHKVSILTLNNPEGDNATTANTGGQGQMVYGVAYAGRFFERSLTAILSYHTVSLGGDTSTNAADEARLHHYVGGLRYEQTWGFVNLDYSHLLSGPVTVAAVKNDGRIGSLVIEGGYRVDRLLIRLKGEQSKIIRSPEGGTNIEQDVLATGLVVEYRPFENQDFRYHLAYTQKWIDLTAASERQETHLIAGLRIQSDFLK